MHFGGRDGESALADEGANIQEGRKSGLLRNSRVRIYRRCGVRRVKAEMRMENDVSDAPFDLGSADTMLLTGSFH